MTKRERRYHDRQKIIRTIRQATRIVMEAFQRYKERHMPVPKYPVGTLPERGMAIVGHTDSHRDVLPPAAFSIGLNIARLPKALFEDHKPVHFAGGNLQEVIKEQMKGPRPSYPVWNIDNI